MASYISGDSPAAVQSCPAGKGKSRMIELRSQYIKSLWGQTAIVVIILAAVLAYAWLVSSREHFTGVFAVCYGFMIGWFAGWLGKRWQIRS
jgi:hypothetical protein